MQQSSTTLFETTIWILKKQFMEQHREFYVAFIDYSKAFDSVNRNKLWGITRDDDINTFDIPHNTTVKRTITNKFQINHSSDLIVINSISILNLLWGWLRKLGSGLNRLKKTNLVYADDLVIRYGILHFNITYPA